MPVFAIDLDYTVDDAIRKNYNVGEPIKQKKITPQKTIHPTKKTTIQPIKKSQPTNINNKTSINNTNMIKNTNKSKIRKNYSNKKYFPIRKGMSFDVANINAISDKQRVGTNIYFETKKPIKTAYYTIPQGTRLVGQIEKSHRPQITGNGGLVSISINNIILGGEYQYIDTRITKVAGKNIYFEDIKGKRSYWKNTKNKSYWGRNTFHKMNKLSASLAKDKTTVVLSPFTFAYGVAMGGVSTITSPVISIFCKGRGVYIPSGTTFKIKFEKDIKIYY